MANGQGGVVVFGVTPAGKLVGQQVTDRTLEELAQEFQGFEPPLFPVVERKVVAETDGKRLELLWSPGRQSTARAGFVQGRTLRTPDSHHQEHLQAH